MCGSVCAERSGCCRLARVSDKVFLAHLTPSRAMFLCACVYTHKRVIQHASPLLGGLILSPALRRACGEGYSGIGRRKPFVTPGHGTPCQGRAGHSHEGGRVTAWAMLCSVDGQLWALGTLGRSTAASGRRKKGPAGWEWLHSRLLSAPVP